MNGLTYWVSGSTCRCCGGTARWSETALAIPAVLVARRLAAVTATAHLPLVLDRCMVDSPSSRRWGWLGRRHARDAARRPATQDVVFVRSGCSSRQNRDVLWRPTRGTLL